MIKLDGFPCAGCMAGFALPAELSHVRIHMAGGTVFGRSLEHIILMAACTRHTDVLPGEREARLAVIETHLHPICGSVAGSAICSQLSLMAVILGMAGNTIRGCALKR